MDFHASVIAAVALVGAGGLFCAASALRWLRQQAGVAGLRGRILLLGGVGVGLLALGARLFQARGQVSWCPYLDQWPAEIAGLLAPLAHGTYTWRGLFASNNEHRVVLTHVVSLMSLVGNGSWDNRVLVIVNYGLQAAAAAWVAVVAGLFLGPRRGAYIALAALLPFFLVCGWENLVSGFQNGIGFMSLGSVAAFSLLESRSLRERGSWTALAIAALLLGSMASGFLTAAAMAGTCAILLWTDRRHRCSTTLLGLLGLALTLIAWSTRPQVPPVTSLYADSVPMWLSAFLAYGAWPLPPGALGFACLWLPCGLLLARMLLTRETPCFAPFALGLGLWVLLQAAALAWSRAGLRELVSARYTDILGWSVVANAAALSILYSAIPRTARLRPAAWACLVLWLGAAAGAETWRSEVIYRPSLTAFRALTIEHEMRLGRFMRTGDAATIESVVFPRIPAPVEEMLPRLRDHQLRPLLPGPLRREWARSHEPERVAAVTDGPLVFLARILLHSGLWLAVLGAAALVLGWRKVSLAG